MTACRFLVCALVLCLAGACNSGITVNKVTPTTTTLQWQCQGGGGRHECVVKNPTSDTYGPFDMEFQAFDDRGRMLGPSTVSISGLGPGADEKFTLLSATQTRRLNLNRVIAK